MRIRVLLVDDNNLFRQGLSALISANDDFTVIADLRGGNVAPYLDLDPRRGLVGLAAGGCLLAVAWLMLRRRRRRAPVAPA